MNVDHPARLAVGLTLVLAFALAYDRFGRRTTSRDLAYSSVAFFVEAIKPRPWIPGLLRLLWLVAVTCVVVAIAGPHLMFLVPARDGEVFVCIDTSGSMASTDVVPTRAQAAKNAARAFIAQSPTGIKIGIIAFSGSAAVVAPLNADGQQVSSALEDVPSPNGATAIGDALKLSAQKLSSSGHRVVILITDGVNNTGADPVEMAQWLGAHHIPVYTVGIGTSNGGLIPGTNEEATIDEDALRGYAQVSGGAYARAKNATQLQDALARLGHITSLQLKRFDASLGFAVIGAVGMLIAFLTGFGLGRYP